jgi:hypothetical protein
LRFFLVKYITPMGLRTNPDISFLPIFRPYGA